MAASFRERDGDSRRVVNEASKVRLSPDGRLLVALLALILLGPYVPLLEYLGPLGSFESQPKIRLDNIAVPLAAAYFLFRELVAGRLIINLTLAFYGAFLAWLTFMTLIYWTGLPGEYFGSETRGIGLLRGFDAYSRPLAVLIIGVYSKTSAYDLRTIVRLTLGVALLLGVIAMAQIYAPLSATVNEFLFNYYDNNPGRHFWVVLQQERVAALMPQLSTLGMYMVLALGLLVAQLMGGRAIKSPVLFSVIVVSTIMGGVMSGSKVFIAGIAILGIATMLRLGLVRRGSGAKILMTIGVLVVMWVIALQLFPTQTGRVVGRMNLGQQVDAIQTQFIAPRFDPNTGKVFRSGAMDVARDYPVTGLGLFVVGRTTDSMVVGIFIMGGAIGSILYLAMLVVMSNRLIRVGRSRFDPEVAAIARALLVLTIIFSIAAIGFHTFIQDRAGDAYWLLVGMVIGPLYHARRSGLNPLVSSGVGQDRGAQNELLNDSQMSGSRSGQV
jgi:hypothetical protein